MPTPSSRRLVIDTDIARSANDGSTLDDARPMNCHQFLESVRKICHQIVMTPDIKEEWDNHRSRYTAGWLVSMRQKRKIHWPENFENDELLEKIERAIESERNREAAQKDFLLIEAALGTDSIIASLDETARNLFDGSAKRVGELRNITWVNPEKLEEEPIAWLQSGANPDKKRQLGFGR